MTKQEAEIVIAQKIGEFKFSIYDKLLTRFSTHVAYEMASEYAKSFFLELEDAYKVYFTGKG